MNQNLHRLFDLVLSIFGIALSFPLLALLTVIGFFDTGSPIFRQQRLGMNQKVFTLIKFRTMHLHTESVATHLIDASKVTRIGRFLRRTKLDELPQLWNVLTGDMSLVGPRPGLPNQVELTEARQAFGVFAVRPGITGLSQISKIEMSTPKKLAESDARMIAELTIASYLKYITITILGKGSGDRIRK